MRTPLPAVDRTSPLPLYHQVASVIEQAIREGRYPPGTLIESEHELAEILGVSRLTLRKSIEELVGKGLLIRERGVGTRVVAPRVTRGLVARLTGLHEDLVKDGLEVVTKVLSLASAPCPERSAEHFGIEPGETITKLERLRLVDGQPIALMWNVFPEGVLEADPVELEEKSLYELLRNQGREPVMANQEIHAAPATGEEARQLEMPVGIPVLVLERVSYDRVGRCIEHSRTRYPGNQYSFEMQLIR